MKRAQFVSVPKQQANVLLKELGKETLVHRRLKTRQEGDLVLIPLQRGLPGEVLERIKESFPDISVGTEEFPEAATRPRNLFGALDDKLPTSLLASLPKSFDLIGDVAIVELPPELEAHGEQIGEAIREVHPKTRLVLAKAGPVAGDTRVRDYRRIAGAGPTEAVHREYDLTFKLDVAKTYFSPRLSNEHYTVAKQVRESETVIDMFTGVGPFSIHIAKCVPTVKVYAIDLNPVAVDYLRENIRLNKVSSQVVPKVGDARAQIANELRGVADRVIMNLPGMAREYLDVCCHALKPEGGVVHYYTFSSQPDAMENARTEFVKGIERHGRKVKDITRTRLVRPTAPREWQVVVDARIA